MRSLITVALAIAPLAMAAPALAQTQIVDVAAVNPSGANFAPTPVTKLFGAGAYDVSMPGKAGGGAFDAWSVATPAAGNWDARFGISYNGTTIAVNPYGGQRFGTATDALAAFSGVLASFTLAADTAVTFSIPDNWWYDNTGGVSLGVTASSPTSVPEPGTMGLFLVGGAALAAIRRRKRIAAEA